MRVPSERTLLVASGVLSCLCVLLAAHILVSTLTRAPEHISADSQLELGESARTAVFFRRIPGGVVALYRPPPPAIRTTFGTGALDAELAQALGLAPGTGFFQLLLVAEEGGAGLPVPTRMLAELQLRAAAVGDGESTVIATLPATLVDAAHRAELDPTGRILLQQLGSTAVAGAADAVIPAGRAKPFLLATPTSISLAAIEEVTLRLDDRQVALEGRLLEPGSFDACLVELLDESVR